MAIITCLCGKRFYTSSAETECRRCAQNAERTEFGLQFKNGTALPTKSFWRAWHRNRDRVKMSYMLQKTTSGKWLITRKQQMRSTKF